LEGLLGSKETHQYFAVVAFDASHAPTPRGPWPDVHCQLRLDLQDRDRERNHRDTNLSFDRWTGELTLKRATHFFNLSPLLQRVAAFGECTQQPIAPFPISDDIRIAAKLKRLREHRSTDVWVARNLWSSRVIRMILTSLGLGEASRNGQPFRSA